MVGGRDTSLRLRPAAPSARTSCSTESSRWPWPHLVIATSAYAVSTAHFAARITFAHHDEPIARQGGGATSGIESLRASRREWTASLPHAATCLPLVVHPVLFVHSQRHASARFVQHQVVPQRLVRRDRLRWGATTTLLSHQDLGPGHGAMTSFDGGSTMNLYLPPFCVAAEHGRIEHSWCRTPGVR